jgi:hypothetical protein
MSAGRVIWILVGLLALAVIVLIARTPTLPKPVGPVPPTAVLQ